MKQAILKAVEMQNGDYLRISYNGGSTAAYPTKSLFSTVTELIRDLSTVLVGSGISVFLGDEEHDDFKCKIHYNTLLSITGTANMFLLLGFTGSETVSSGYIKATYRPENIFIPTYHSSDDGYFQQDFADTFKGVTGSDGNLSGVKYYAKYKRTIKWPAEFATNSIIKADGATSFQTERCFQNIIQSAREMVCLNEDSSNKYCKGVYLTKDLETLANTTISGNGTIDGDYIYCTASEPNITGQTAQNNNHYYDIEVDLITGTAPTW